METLFLLLLFPLLVFSCVPTGYGGFWDSLNVAFPLKAGATFQDGTFFVATESTFYKVDVSAASVIAICGNFAGNAVDLGILEISSTWIVSLTYDGYSTSTVSIYLISMDKTSCSLTTG